MRTKTDIRAKLLEAGVRNLKEWGYSSVDVVNILSDPVFVAAFRSMLKENLGHGAETDAAIHGLLAELPPK